MALSLMTKTDIIMEAFIPRKVFTLRLELSLNKGYMCATSIIFVPLKCEDTPKSPKVWLNTAFEIVWLASVLLCSNLCQSVILKCINFELILVINIGHRVDPEV